MSYSEITATNIKGISGVPLNGWVTFTGPVNGSGAPVSAIEVGGGPIMFETKKFLVVNGAITTDDSTTPQPAQVIDTTTTNPENIGYTVKFYDNVRGQIKRTGYDCVQPSGTTWSLDEYVPAQPALSLITSGPRGLQGAPGIASLAQLASVRAAGPVANLFNAADPTVVVGYYQGADGTLSSDGSYPSFLTHKIVANSGGHMTINHDLVNGAGGDFCEYDQNETFLRGRGGPFNSGVPFTVSADAAYIIASVKTDGSTASAVAAGLMVVNGSTLPSVYLPFATPNLTPIIGSVAALTTTVAGKPSLQQVFQYFGLSPNVFRKSLNQTQTGYYFNIDGTTAGGGSYSDGFITGPIPANPGGNMTVNLPLVNGAGAPVLFLAGDGSYLSAYSYPGGGPAVPANTPFPVPSGAAFIRLAVNSHSANWAADLAGMMVSFGNAVPSVYTSAELPNSATSVPSLAGKNVAIVGDSIAAFDEWQTAFFARTGANFVYQDARSGRQFPQAFEFYGTVTPGGTLTTATATNVPSPTASAGSSSQGGACRGIVIGQTLAQNLANVDILILALGTNDQLFPTGALGDATNAGTMYGNVRWVVETFLAAKPTLRIVGVTPALNNFGNNDTPFNPTLNLAAVTACVNAVATYYESMAIPYRNMLKTSGVNAITSAVLTRDPDPAKANLGTHPADSYFPTWGNLIADTVLAHN